MDVHQLDINSAQEGLKKGEFSAVELVREYLHNVENRDKILNAFITICPDQALKEAEKVDELLKNKKSEVIDKPLLGIPVAVKDIFCTKGIRTTAASKVLENYMPVYDSTVVARLKEAGAIILGKTNLDAWAHGASGENSDFGPTKNPWNPDYVPGGSSSGSAVSVAADMSLLSLGTDTGGSTRFPASFCNVVGLKPTYGRISRYGVIAMASSLDTVGCFAHTVSDVAYLLGILAGQDGKDATCPNVPVSDYLKNVKRGVKGLKIGIPKEYFIEGMDERVEKTVKEAIKVFEKLGAEIVEVSLPHTRYAVATYYIIQPAEVSSNLARYDGIRYGSARQNFGDEAKRRIMLGTYTLSSGYYEAYYLKAMQVRTLIKKDFDDVFNKVDCLISPVSPTPPFKLGEKVHDPLKMYLCDVFTVTANLAGIPGLAIGAGFVDSLPIGVQILGPQFSEELLFQVGYAFEQATNYYGHKPCMEKL